PNAISNAHVYLYTYDCIEGSVKINGREDITDSGGFYKIEYYRSDFGNLVYQAYLVVIHDDYDLALEEIHTNEWGVPGAVQPDIYCFDDNGLRTYTGYVRNRNTYQPIPNAKVVFGRIVYSNIVEQWVQTKYTDSNGKFTFSYDPSELFIHQYVIKVSKTGYIGPILKYIAGEDIIHYGGSFGTVLLRNNYN
ncbi:MAG: carboxypeptidase-like regulatory domain-containing protein, partial [Candidatus Heimdallarchaeota archaeon]